MYRIQILPLAHRDMQKTVEYISIELSNPDAALDWLDALEESLDMLKDFPYAHPLHTLPYTLPSETRFYPVKKYLVFYVVIEPERIVEIRRVIYARMDIKGVSL